MLRRLHPSEKSLLVSGYENSRAVIGILKKGNRFYTAGDPIPVVYPVPSDLVTELSRLIQEMLR
jgi:hypothetical protein